MKLTANLFISEATTFHLWKSQTFKEKLTPNQLYWGWKRNGGRSEIFRLQHSIVTTMISVLHQQLEFASLIFQTFK